MNSPNIPVVPVQSSNILAIGYQKNVMFNGGYQPKDVLRIKFVSGYSYDYLNVDEEVFKQLMQEESKGSFFHRKIKDKYISLQVV